MKVEDGEQDILVDFRETIGQPPSHQLDTRIAPAGKAKYPPVRSGDYRDLKYRQTTVAVA